MTYVRFGTAIAWTWYVLIGTTVTFAVGYAGRFAGRPGPKRRKGRDERSKSGSITQAGSGIVERGGDRGSAP